MARHLEQGALGGKHGEVSWLDKSTMAYLGRAGHIATHHGAHAITAVLIDLDWPVNNGRF